MSDSSLGKELLKQLLKPGYLYGIGTDGELYTVKVDFPPPKGCIKSLPLLEAETLEENSED